MKIGGVDDRPGATRAHSRRLAGYLVVCVLGALGFGRIASGAGNSAPVGDGLEEVVVTATRQGEQSLQTVPMAISVIDAAKLDEQGRGGINDFVRELPSVSIQSESPGVNRIDMRGVVTNSTDVSNVQDRPLVQLYLDDAPLSLQSGNPNLQVYDLERVEVLRGPQGTLYGAGSMSGTIRLITKHPDLADYSGDAIGTGSYTTGGSGNYSVRGMLNLPITSDKLGVRLTAYRSDWSGFIDNITYPKNPNNAGHTTQGRVALRWKPSDTITLDASATLAKLSLDGRDAIYPDLGHLRYAALAPPETLSDDFKLFNLTGTFDLSIGQLIASASYTDRNFIPGLSLQYLAEAYVTGGVPQPSTSYFDNQISRFTQEIRLVSRPDSTLHWIVGAYYEDFHRDLYQDTPSPGLDAFVASAFNLPGFNSQEVYGTPTPDDLFYGTQFVEERQYALFGEATLPLAPRWDLTLGVRYYNYRTNFDVYYTGLAGADLDGSPITQTGTQKSTGANPRAVLAYRPSDTLMLFAEAARGFRYGGVNQPISPSFCGPQIAYNFGTGPVPISFGPDKLWSYSLGEKATLGGGRTTLNATAFFIDWIDVQTNNYIEDASGTSCGYFITQNAGNVHSRGLELEARTRVTSSLVLGLSGSLTDAAANGPIPNLGAVDGNPVPYFPKQIANVFADYVVPLQRGRIALSCDWTYRSDSYTEFNPQNSLWRRIPSSSLLGANVTYEQDHWSIGVFATNLTNNLATTGIAANTYAPYQPGDEWQIGRPRTIGLNLHVHY